MHNGESVLENEAHNILWDFNIETDPVIMARGPDILIVNKKDVLPNRVIFRFG